VTAANCKELAGKPDVDGFLVGGASLKVMKNPGRQLMSCSFVNQRVQQKYKMTVSSLINILCY
jgi:triosephosphate isomerase